MDQTIDDRDDLAQNIFGNAKYDLATISRRKFFLPWHKPRKQYVREKQWKVEIVNLLGQLPLGENRPLRYLGLPGTDLLDIRFFHREICVPHNINLFFLGFNTAADPKSAEQNQFNINRDEVKRLSHIDKLSNVIPDDYRDIGEMDSKAWESTRSNGPYDVVNLDLCDGFAKEQPGEFTNTHYAAMLNLLQIQARRDTPWLLLLTTRVGGKHVHNDVLKILVDAYTSNLSTCKEFQAESEQHLGIADAAALHELIKTDKGASDVFVTGICKWLLGNCLEQKPQSVLEARSVVSYRVRPQASINDLISIAVKITPTFAGAKDPLGLHKDPKAPISECDYAPFIVDVIANTSDVDALMSKDAKLDAALTNAMEQLLTEARYDAKQFHAWIAAGCPSVAKQEASGAPAATTTTTTTMTG